MWSPSARSPATKDGALALALGLLALALRSRLAGAAPYGDEGAHFVMARTLGVLPTHVQWMSTGEPFTLLALVVGRPLFGLAHAPGAMLGGFTGFRIAGLAYASLLAPAGFLALRRFGTGRGFAAAAGLVLAIHPAFAAWGARVFPDHAMAVLALAALGTWAAGHPRATAVLTVLACWAKESALPVAAGLAALAAVTAWREGRHGVAALVRDRGVRWAVAAVAVGALPLVAQYLVYPRLPGWATGGDLAAGWERLWLSAWLSLLPLLALAVPRLRPLAVAGLALAAFYLANSLVRGVTLQSWYAILPASLGVLAAAALADAGWRRADGWRPAAACATALLLAAALAGVAGAGPSAALHPLARETAEPGLAAALRFVQQENPELAAAAAFQARARPAHVLELDVYWHWIVHPLGGQERTELLHPVLMRQADVDARRVASTAESSDLVWVHHWGGSLTTAFQQVYADCKVFESGNLLAFDVRSCAGRGEWLAEAFSAAPVPPWQPV